MKRKLDKTDFIVLLLLAGGLWAFWPRGGTPPPPEAPPTAATEPGKKDDAATPKVEGPTVGPQTPGAATPSVPAVLTVLSNAAGAFEFTNIGGGIRKATVQAAPFAGKTEQELNARINVGAIGGLAVGAGEMDSLPYTIKEQTPKSITFESTAMTGLVITKKWTMVEGEGKDKDRPERGSGYLWDLKVTIKNTGTAKFSEDDFFLYTGAAGQLHAIDGRYVLAGYLADGKATEIPASDFDASRFLGFLWERHPARETIEAKFDKLTWGGVVSQYYATLISPVTPDKGQLWARRIKETFMDDTKEVSGYALHAGVGLPAVSLEPGKDVSLDYQVFVGPRSGTLLGRIGGERQDAMFYGMTGGLSRLFLWLMNHFNSWTGSFGVAIILLTLVVRIAIWPLHIKATRSMKRMSQLAPLMNEIRDRYKDKPQTREGQQKMQMEMMGLYREYHVSPLGGCLPLLLQMPIFFGYFGMLNHAVEMRGHSFAWAPDLTLPDTVFKLWGFPINPLPLIMTVTMYLQMKFSPTPQSNDQNVKLQMKIFKFMPLFFLFFCYFNPSALALYWTVQNIISIGQTSIMKLFPEPVLEKRAKLPRVSGAGPAGGWGQPEKPKGPKPPRTGGSTKSAFKKRLP